MNYSPAERHLLLSDSTRTARFSTVSLESKIFADIENGKYFATDFMDFTQAVSGDDLARIAAFEPKREPSLWGDVTTNASAVAA